MAKPDRNNSCSDQELDEIFDAVMHFKPPIGQADSEGIEAAMNGSGSFAVMRRLGLALATQDGAWFKKIASDREAAKTAAAQLPDLNECVMALRKVADLIEGAVVRTEIALCNWDDLAQLKEEAKPLTLFQEAA